MVRRDVVRASVSIFLAAALALGACNKPTPTAARAPPVPAAAPALTPPAGVADAEAFMRAFYTLPATPIAVPETELERYFTPDLARALATDIKQLPEHQRLDFDYRIDGQDGDIDHHHVTVSGTATAGGARVDVRFPLDIDKGVQPDHVIYLLRPTPDGWRITDVSALAENDFTAFSLRQVLGLPPTSP